MEHRSLIRLFGLCSFIGGLLMALVQIWFVLDSISFVATYFDHVGWAFMTFGLIGLYLVQYREIGGLGFLNFLVLSLGMFQWLGYKWFLTFAAPDLRRDAPEIIDSGLQSLLYGVELSNYILQTSFFLFAVISLYKGILPKGGLSFLLIGSALAFNAQLEDVILYNPVLPQILIGLAFAWIGLSLFSLNLENTYKNEVDKKRANGENLIRESKPVSHAVTLDSNNLEDLQSVERKQEVGSSR